jgi:hypothetical protein
VNERDAASASERQEVAIALRKHGGQMVRETVRGTRRQKALHLRTFTQVIWRNSAFVLICSMHHLA